MKCVHCGRGLTFHRGEEYPHVAVCRADMSTWLTLENGDKIRPTSFLYYCGTCFEIERHEHQSGDLYGIALGDSPKTCRWEPLTLTQRA